MGYSNYREIEEVVKKFGLDTELGRLFRDTATIEPSAWLRETLSLFDFWPVNSEKAQAERLISPILLDAVRPFRTEISFFSGAALEAQAEADLAGATDFCLTLNPLKPYLDAPIISLISTKKVAAGEDKSYGLAQCAAQMLGAKFYNEARNKPLSSIYGCVTNGYSWQFMKLENDVYYIDNKIFTDLSEVLGVWRHIIKLYL